MSEEKIIEQLKENLKFAARNDLSFEINHEYTLKINDYIEQLQQENQELKSILDTITKSWKLNVKKVKELNNILTEFEKWLEEKMKCTEQYADNDMAKGYINAIKLCKYYLQELKEGKK